MRAGCGDEDRKLGPLLVRGFGAHEVLAGHLGLGAMLGATQLALAFLTPLSALVQTAVRLQTTASQVERIEEIQATPCEALRAGAPAASLAGGIDTVRDADLIVVMEAGRVVEQGTHEGLLARGGAYARLVRAAARGASTPEERVS